MAQKKILVMPDGNWLAHVSRPYEIAKVLREMGYEIIFASQGEYMRLPRKAGFKVLPIKTPDPDRVLGCTRRGRTDWYDYNLLKECVREDLKLFKKIKPDLILGDFRLSLSTSSKIAKIPLVVTINASWTNYYAIRIRSVEHSKIAQILKKTIGKQLTNWLAPWIKKLIIAYDSLPYRKLQREMGLRPCKNVLEAMEGDLNLLTDIPEYAPTENLPSNFHYIGPIVWEPEMDSPSWLNNLDGEKPILYFTMGSTGYPTFFEEAIKIFGNNTCQCIMTTAGMVKLVDIPKNFFVMDYGPGSKIMEKSDVVICHGGNGTVYQAMAKGVPIIGIPTTYDQEFNMHRVVDLGIGIQLSELKFKPSHLVKAVEKILVDKNYKERAEIFKKILANYNGAKRGAELIDAYLNGQP